MIVAAAIKFGELVCFMPQPARHVDINLSFVLNYEKGQRTSKSYYTEVKGFLTDKGEFLNRREAFDHARECKQNLLRSPGSRYQHGYELYTEDLW